MAAKKEKEGEKKQKLQYDILPTNLQHLEPRLKPGKTLQNRHRLSSRDASLQPLRRGGYNRLWIMTLMKH